MLLLVSPLIAQTQAEQSVKFAFAGLALFQEGSPQLQGCGGLAMPIAADGKILSYSDWDVTATLGTKAVGQKIAPVMLRYSIRTGLAFRL